MPQGLPSVGDIIRFVDNVKKLPYPPYLLVGVGPPTSTGGMRYWYLDLQDGSKRLVAVWEFTDYEWEYV